MLDKMFTTAETMDTASNARGLAGTAQLTNVATQLVAEAIKKLNDEFETYKEQFEASKASHDAMDALIAQLVDIDSVDVEFLKQLDETVLDGMLKSQQSKRSRAKGKVMTLDNYKAMMSGAIAENLIRLATGKTKAASTLRRTTASEYTAEELEHFKNDQDDLRRELRNVQSKKSIMKSKADFSEEDPRWQVLLVQEEQLKSVRVNVGGTRVVEVDKTKEKLAATLKDVDVNSLKAQDSKTLLAQIAALLGNDE